MAETLEEIMASRNSRGSRLKASERSDNTATTARDRVINVRAVETPKAKAESKKRAEFRKGMNQALGYTPQVNNDPNQAVLSEYNPAQAELYNMSIDELSKRVNNANIANSWMNNWGHLNLPYYNYQNMMNHPKEALGIANAANTYAALNPSTMGMQTAALSTALSAGMPAFNRLTANALNYAKAHPYELAADNALQMGAMYAANKDWTGNGSTIDWLSQNVGGSNLFWNNALSLGVGMIPTAPIYRAVGRGYNTAAGQLNNFYDSRIAPWVSAWQNRNLPYATNPELQQFVRNFGARKYPNLAWDDIPLDANNKYYGYGEGTLTALRENPVAELTARDGAFIAAIKDKNSAKAVGVNIDLADGGKGPGAAGKRFAYEALAELPHGTYISSNSLTPSLNGLVQRDGFWKTFLSPKNGIFSKRSKGQDMHLTENSYETILDAAAKNPDKYRLDFVHGATGQLHPIPRSADTSKLFYQLYNDALNTGDLRALNTYLLSRGAPAAKLNANGTIELGMPILYKRKYGGKLRYV